MGYNYNILLFIENPAENASLNIMVSELLVVKQRLIKEIEDLIQNVGKTI